VLDKLKPLFVDVEVTSLPSDIMDMDRTLVELPTIVAYRSCLKGGMAAKCRVEIVI